MSAKEKVITFKRTLDADIQSVWEAWTNPEHLAQWWGAEKTLIPECTIDLRVGGSIRIVTEAGEKMGKYAGTRWPLEGTITQLDEPHTLTYEAKAHTEGEENSAITQTNALQLTEAEGKTQMLLTVTIHESQVKMAAFGLKMGYKSQFKKLDAFLSQK